MFDVRYAKCDMKGRRRLPGFTLIEMMVVVAIIVILLGIGLAVGPAVLNKGEEKRTQMILSNASALLEEYLNLTGQGAIPDDGPADATDGVNYLFTKASAIKKMEPMFGSFDKRALKESGNVWSLVDGWENEIHLKWADGKEPSNGNLPDEGFAYFASKGLDGQWGNVDASVGTEDRDQEADNIYSYQLFE